MQSVQDYALDQIRMRCVRSLVDRGQLILGLAHLLAANRRDTAGLNMLRQRIRLSLLDPDLSERLQE